MIYNRNSALDVQNCPHSFRFTRIHICFVSHFKIALNYLKHNLRHPFENCEFTPPLYRITEIWICWLHTHMPRVYKQLRSNRVVFIIYFLSRFCGNCPDFLWQTGNSEDQGTVSDIPFRISMEELPQDWWKVQCTYVLHRWLISYITWYNYIIFCPTDCVTILLHVFCRYTTFKIYAATL
jgi:hypothetical protein